MYNFFIKYVEVLTTFLATLKKGVLFQFSHHFCSNYKFENRNIFHFSSSIWSESFNCSKKNLRKLFWKNVFGFFRKCHTIFGNDHMVSLA